MKFLLLVLTLQMFNSYAFACSKVYVQKSKPPRLVNGEWVSDNSNATTTKITTDFQFIKNKDYDFIFSGTYKKDLSLGKQNRGYIETKAIWQGSVPQELGLNASNLPKQNTCDLKLLSFDHEYIFFGKLGNRNNPIRIKEFRGSSFELKSLLGKPSKQWLRGRLIQRK